MPRLTPARRTFSVLIGLACLASASLVVAQQPEATPSFERDIQPIFEKHCYACHGADQQASGLDLRRKFLVLRGGDSGPAIVEGKPDESLLVARIEAGEMPPPDEAEPLGDADRELIRRWVAAGAPLDEASEPPLDGEPVSRFSDEDLQFWSFQPPVRPEVPTVQNTDRVRTPIDAFLLARLEEKGLSFSPEASRTVLIRRLYFDLLGVPPSPAELDEFLSDTRSNAYELLVDRLLNDPRYGERWARHWLDLAGYADSDGYLAADRLRPEAWRYRDYVIQAFNEDLPYDRFILEQLAGDELYDWRRAEELTPEMIRALVATGFLRTASDPTYPGYTEPNEIHQVMSDTMQIVGTSLLGLTIQCARCHTHKFDPISHRDYFSLQAIFLPALDPDRWQPSEVRGIPLATEAQQERIKTANEQADRRIAELNAQLADLTARYRKKRVREALAAKEPAPSAQLVDQLVAALAVDAAQRNDEQKQLIAAQGVDLSLAEAALAEQYPEYAEQSKKLQSAVQAETSLKRSITLIRGLADLEGPPPQAVILQRGDYNKPGAPVEPAVLEVLADKVAPFSPEPGYKTTGRRLAFARWLTQPDHPLTARVQVNRMWARHFGRGLVETLANFGKSGARPTHPELLDWLATEFVREGWSMKAMHRLMVLSSAYRQSSARSPEQIALDPANELLSGWRPRRNEGEVVRDSILSVAGKLNPQMFNSPVPVVAQPDGSVITADDPQGNRRSIYLIVRRSQHLTMLDLFDTPVMEVNCPERNVSTVPLQSLALMHSQFAESAAAALGARLRASASDDAERIRYALRLAFSRDPTDVEMQAMLQFLDDVRREAVASSTAEAGAVDPQAADELAWNQLALVLLNSNEFVYVD